jgi:hypothetical protein
MLVHFANSDITLQPEGGEFLISTLTPIRWLSNIREGSNECVKIMAIASLAPTSGAPGEEIRNPNRLLKRTEIDIKDHLETKKSMGTVR